jgi:hypothetical protein
MTLLSGIMGPKNEFIHMGDVLRSEIDAIKMELINNNKANSGFVGCDGILF